MLPRCRSQEVESLEVLFVPVAFPMALAVQLGRVEAGVLFELRLAAVAIGEVATRQRVVCVVRNAVLAQAREQLGLDGAVECVIETLR